MIRRRTLLKVSAAAGLGAPGLSGLAQQAVTLKFHTFMAPQSNVWLTMHKPWMDKVEKESGGRIKFEGYPAMQLGGTPVQLYDQAKDVSMGETYRGVMPFLISDVIRTTLFLFFPIIPLWLVGFIK